MICTYRTQELQPPWKEDMPSVSLIVMRCQSVRELQRPRETVSGGWIHPAPPSLLGFFLSAQLQHVRTLNPHNVRCVSVFLTFEITLSCSCDIIPTFTAPPRGQLSHTVVFLQLSSWEISEWARPSPSGSFVCCCQTQIITTWVWAAEQPPSVSGL